MVAPLLDPVELRILDDIKATLEAISPTSETASFWTTVRRVHDMDTGPLETREHPAVCIVHVGTPRGRYEGGGIQIAELFLELYPVMVREAATWKRDIVRFASDVERALAIDANRGNVDGQSNAFDTVVTQIDVANESEGFNVALARIDVQVTFRYPSNDPTQSV